MAEQKKARGRPRKAVTATARVEMRMEETKKIEWIEKAEKNGYTNLSKWISSLVEAA